MSAWMKINITLSVISALFIITAFLGLLSVLMISEGILSNNNAVIVFIAMLTSPMIAYLLIFFVYSSVFLGVCIYLYLVHKELSNLLRKLFIVHSLYEVSYVVFYLVVFGKKWG